MEFYHILFANAAEPTIVNLLWTNWITLLPFHNPYVILLKKDCVTFADTSNRTPRNDFPSHAKTRKSSCPPKLRRISRMTSLACTGSGHLCSPRRRSDRFFVYLVLYLYTFFFLHRAMSSVVALGANIICNKLPGLSPRQRTICQSRPDAMVAVGEGTKIGLGECKYQFRHNRWNCTPENPKASLFDQVPTLGSREAAYTHAIRSAGVAFAVTQGCSQGNLTSCGCDKTKKDGKMSPKGFQWGGCSADVTYGLRFSRLFMDAKEADESDRALMNLHNNKAGRKAMQDKTRTECKCHGVSGSCTMRTCWTTLPRFREVGDRLLKKYKKAKEVVPIKGRRALKPIFLKLKRSQRAHKKPRKRDLVFLDKSPNYCDADPVTGSLGTAGRRCNRTSQVDDGCDMMCCGRGYNTHQFTRTWQCNCKFVWCCHVTCHTCSERTEEYTCK